MKIKKGIVVWICAAALMMLPGLAHQTQADEIYDGGTLPEVNIVCPAAHKNYGRCHVYNYAWFNSNSAFGEYTCRYTGKTVDRCSHVLVKFSNLILP